MRLRRAIFNDSTINAMKISGTDRLKGQNAYDNLFRLAACAAGSDHRA